jgi:hypothetical protein
MANWNEDGRLVVTENDYDDETAKQFIRDAEESGFEAFHYEGRCFWQGPAIVGDIDYLETEVPLKTDSMGLDYVIYPCRTAYLNAEVPEYPEE